jgi:hypothetical protein
MSDTLLSPAELIELTGTMRPAEQLRALLARGFFRARRAKVTGEVILERPHYEAVRAGAVAAPAAPFTLPSMRRRTGPRAAFPWNVRTALYRHFDKAGRLLYIGIAVDPAKREGEHRRESEWRGRIARVELEWYGDRHAARAAERAAIAAEQPPFNVLHTRSPS